MKIAAQVLLSVALLLTLWMIQADRDVPNHTSRWGEIPMGTTIVLIFFRWIVLSVAFVLLSRVYSSGAWKTVLALAAIFALEIASYHLHRMGLTTEVKPDFQTLFLALATLSPLVVVAGGFFSSRMLCAVGVVVAVVALMVGTSGEKTFLAVKRPYWGYTAETPIAFMLNGANPMYEPVQLQELWGHIEQHSDWAEQVATQLDGENRMYALYVLCHDPGRLSEVLQERCWTVAGQAAREMKAPFTTVTVLQLRESVKALDAVSGAVRDRHREDFAAARETVKLAHQEAPSIPVLH